ncbi:MAG TPA: hypothetical protein VE269_01150 [Gaiellaceae bacterium]|nr:hypothetical protein [Gaiellaceae bacterium]
MRNDRARASVLFALLSLAAVPAAAYASHLKGVNVPQAVGGEAVAGTVLGLVAVALARRARAQARWSLSRTGETTARWGRWLGWLGLCLGLTAALSLGFFGLLLAFE